MARHRLESSSKSPQIIYVSADPSQSRHPFERRSRWKIYLVEIGSFVLFAATYGQYVVREVWAIIGPLLHR